MPSGDADEELRLIYPIEEHKIMRIKFIPAISIAAMLVGSAAFAQSTGQPGAAQKPGPSQQQSPATSPGTQPSLMTKHSVEQSLQAAGFKDVKILDESFLVHAQSPDGTEVVMVVNPPAQSQSATGQSGRGNGGTASTANSGAGVQGLPGNKSGKTLSPSGSVTPERHATGQDQSGVRGLPDTKSGTTVKPQQQQ
jgi:hypothetical protein